MNNWNQGFWKGLFREEDGTPSFSRMASGGLLIAVLSWVTYVVLKSHAIPDLSGVGTFLTTGFLSLYGINKSAAVIKTVADRITGNSQ